VHGLRRFIRERFHLDVLLRDLSVDHSIIFEASKALLDPAGAQRLRSTPSSRPTTSLFVFNADVHRRKNPDAEAPLSLDLKSLPFGTLPLLATSNNMEPRARFFPGHGDNEPSFLPVAAIYHYEIALHMMRLLDPERNRSWLGSTGCIRALMSVPRHLHRAGKWCQLRVLLCSFGYAKLIVNNCCISGAVIQYTEALRCAAAAGAACVPPMSADAWWLGAQQVRDWSSFLSKQARCLSRSPGLLYQLALNEPDYSAVTSSTLHMQVKGWFGGNHLKCVNKMDVFQEAEPIRSIHKAVREFETCSDILNRQALGEAPFVRDHFSLLNNTLLQDAGSAAYLNAADMNGDVEGANIVHVYNASKILYGHVGWIKATSFTKDDKYLVSGADDKEILVWNCVSGMRVAQMQGHAKSVTCISLSFDTAKLVSGSMDGTAKIWELSSCIEISTLFVGSVVNSVEFSRDAENVLVASQDAIIRIFHVNTTVELRRMIGHVLSVRCASYGPDGLMVASCSSDLAVILWDLRRPEDDSMVAVLTGHTDDIRQLVWVKQNLQIASCSNDSTIRVWNIDASSCVRALTGHKGAVTSLATPGEGLRLVSCGVDGTCRIWSTMISQCLAVFHCSSGPLFSVTASSDLYTICTTQSDGSIKLWDTRGVITEDPGDGSELVGGKTHSSVSHTRPTTAVSDSAKQWRSRPSSAALHPIAATSAISRNPFTHVLSEASETYCDRGSSTAFVDNQQSLAASLGRKVIHREAPRTQKGAVCALAFSRSGDVLASASHDGTYALRDANTGMMLCPPRRTNDNGCFALVFSRVEDRIATAGDDDVVRLWDLEYGNALNFFGGNGDYCKSLCFTEDANLLVAGASDSTVRLWDCRAPPPAQRAAVVIQVHSVAVSALGCAPDGYSLLSGDVNGNLRLCDLRRPSIAVQRWLGHTDAVTGICFCPMSVDNVAAVSTSMDGQALLWNRGAVVGSIGRLTPFELEQQLDRTGALLLRASYLKVLNARLQVSTLSPFSDAQFLQVGCIGLFQAVMGERSGCSIRRKISLSHL
jgi:WD40 repeat protein